METTEKIQDTNPALNQKKPQEIAREELKELSKQVKPLVKEGVYPTINQAIIEEIYKDETNHEFKTYNQWDKEDHFVRKGEKGFPLWGAPKNIDQEVEKNELDKEDNNKSFFPLAYVFSDNQVEQKVLEQQEMENQIVETQIEEIETTMDDFDSVREQAKEQDMSPDLER
ncbi:MAG: ArdC-like ssDNA-binding domain-containing protein [bacterium]|nr:ArdC-like ssDNA-binding domain-containing protein [bacterium]